MGSHCGMISVAWPQCLPLAAIAINPTRPSAPQSHLGPSPFPNLIGQLTTKNLTIALLFDRAATVAPVQESGHCARSVTVALTPALFICRRRRKRHGQLMRDLLWTVTLVMHRSRRLLALRTRNRKYDADVTRKPRPCATTTLTLSNISEYMLYSILRRRRAKTEWNRVDDYCSDVMILESSGARNCVDWILLSVCGGRLEWDEWSVSEWISRDEIASRHFEYSLLLDSNQLDPLDTRVYSCVRALQFKDFLKINKM